MFTIKNIIIAAIVPSFNVSCIVAIPEIIIAVALYF